MTTSPKADHQQSSRNRPNGSPSTPPADTTEPRAAIPRPVAEPLRSGLTGFWVAMALTVMGVIAWRALRRHDPLEAPTVIDAEVPGPPVVESGPWRSGEVNGSYVEVRLPAPYVSPIECVQAQEPWVFRGRSIDAVVSLARASGVDPAQSERMRSLGRCDANGCIVTPDAALIEWLGPREARTALYADLAKARENRLHSLATMRPREVGPWSEMQGVSPRIRDLIGRATWIADGAYAFSDLPWMCSQLATDAERVEAVSGPLLSLHARRAAHGAARRRPRADGALVERRQRGLRGARHARARPRRASHRARGLAPSAHGARARGHLPERTTEWDCYWSSTRFFGGATPNDDIPDVSRAESYLQSAYYELHDEGDRRPRRPLVLPGTPTATWCTWRTSCQTTCSSPRTAAPARARGRSCDCAT